MTEDEMVGWHALMLQGGRGAALCADESAGKHAGV